MDAFKRKLDEEVPKWQKRYGVPGVAIGIVHEGKAVYTLNYGYADKRGHKALTADTLFQAGSVSKSVAAWGVLRLVDQGVLSLDDPLREVCNPGIALLYSRYSVVSCRLS